MTPFERRLARLEAARKMRLHGREVFVIYADEEADITRVLFAIGARATPTKPW